LSRPAKVTLEEWVDVGLNTLRHHGFSALKADRLAKEKRVTRGSFYNNFNNVEDFYRAIIQNWKEESSQKIITQLDQLPSKRVALENLLYLSFGNNERLERQMRIWAENDPLPREAVAEVDNMRVTYLHRLLLENGVPSKNAITRANIIYDCYLGCSMRRRLSPQELERLVSDLMILCQ